MKGNLPIRVRVLERFVQGFSQGSDKGSGEDLGRVPVRFRQV